MSTWEIIDGNLATPLGFRAAAVSAGIKKAAGALDLALIVSDSDRTTAAGMFTTNRLAAAPVLISREHLRRSGGRARAIVVNSGNANCATGVAGSATSRQVARIAARLLRVRPEQVLVASTGVIGLRLKAEVITKALPALLQALTSQGSSAANGARGMMTQGAGDAARGMMTQGASDAARGMMTQGAGNAARGIMTQAGSAGDAVHGMMTQGAGDAVRGMMMPGAGDVARAIMTTDTFPKSVALRSTLAGRPVHLAGVAKGAGMIHPRMATMLAFLTTDAEVSARDLQRFLRQAVEVSFNRVSVDGDTSTNDTVLILASGAAGVAVRAGTKAGAHFLAGLTELCQSLAKMIARDGEGAHKLVTLEIRGARTPADAERVARAIANSPLVKTALAGSDPNWGRILCAAGYSGAVFDPAKVDILVNRLALCRRGLDTGFDEAAARRQLDARELTLRVDLHAGKASTTFWTCDFTRDYIDINASYRT